MSRENRSEGDKAGRRGVREKQDGFGLGLGFGSSVMELPRLDTNVEKRVVTGVVENIIV